MLAQVHIRIYYILNYFQDTFPTLSYTYVFTNSRQTYTLYKRNMKQGFYQLDHTRRNSLELELIGNVTILFKKFFSKITNDGNHLI